MTHIVAEPPATLPAVDCAPWCRFGDGHTDAFHPDDQWCGSESERVYLTRVRMVKLCDNSYVLDDMRAFLMRERFEAEPKIHLGHGEASGVDLTPDEARQLGEALIRLADQA